MNSAHLRIALPATVLLGLSAGPALAQRPPSPEQRIAVLEQRLDSIERQLQQLINVGEVNGHQAGQLRTDISRLRSDLESRLTALETRPVPQQVVEEPSEISSPALTERRTEVAESPPTPRPLGEGAAATASDPGEDAYSEGFRLWRDGKYDQAIVSLRAFLSGFPDHRRASFARNLIGRSLLDKGQPRPAAEALLANYRTDPKGERAPDSLYYLGQALMKLDQPSQACKAYSELEDMYGAAIRPDLKGMVSEGKAEARCS